MPTVYEDRQERGDRAVEVRFTGPAEGETAPAPPATPVTVRCLRRASVGRYSPWLECWRRDFDAVTSPDGAWNGLLLGALFDDCALVGVGSEVLRMDLDGGAVAWRAATGNTPIHYVARMGEGDFVVVCNGTFGFEHPDGGSNVCRLDLDGSLRWRAELPSADDCYPNPPVFAEGRLRVASWNGYDCTIDLETGAVIDTLLGR